MSRYESDIWIQFLYINENQERNTTKIGILTPRSSKPTTRNIELSGAQNRIYFVEFHKCLVQCKLKIASDHSQRNKSLQFFFISFLLFFFIYCSLNGYCNEMRLPKSFEIKRQKNIVINNGYVFLYFYFLIVLLKESDLLLFNRIEEKKTSSKKN